MLEFSTVECIDAFNEEGLQSGEMYKVRMHPIDRSKWYIVTENNDWNLYDSWRFNYLIDQYAICEKHYGSFQLPILEINKFDLTVILPSGFVVKVSLEDCSIANYAYLQRLNCGDVRFR